MNTLFSLFLHAHHEEQSFFDVVLDTLKDTWYLVIFLFVTYFILEYINKKHLKKLANSLKDNPFSYPLAALSGLVPQCGFSATTATLYLNRVVPAGVLLTALIATSDEALLILLGERQFLEVGVLLLSKLVIAIIFGFLFDKIFTKKRFESKEDSVVGDVYCCSKTCSASSSILKNAIFHTIKVSLFVMITAFILNVIIWLISAETLEKILLTDTIFQPILAVLIGLIPNCASSIILSNLYVSGSLSFASLLAGLIVNGGIGIIVLFTSRKNIKNNLIIVFSLICIALVVGIILSLFPISF